MRKLIRIGTALVLTIFTCIVADAHEDHSPSEKRVFTKHFNDSLFAITEQEGFSLELILDESEYPIGKGAVGIVIHDFRDSDVVGATVSLVHKNAESGETATGQYEIKDHGNGLYTVSGLDLSRDGRWELTVSVTKADLRDSARFLFPEMMKERYTKGRYSP